MDDQLVGSTTASLLQAIRTAQSWYIGFFEGGSPSLHDAATFQKKFISTGLDTIFCLPQDPEDLPLGDVQEKLLELNGMPVKSLSKNQLPFYSHYATAVAGFSMIYTQRKAKLDAEKNWKRRSGLESKQVSVLLDLFKPLRALLLLLRAIHASEDDLCHIRLDELIERCPEYESGGGRADIIFYADIMDASPSVIFELKKQERAIPASQDRLQTHWIHMAYDYALGNPCFSKREEHISKYEFSPDNVVVARPPSKGSQSGSSKHIPTPGTPIPSRPINSESLYKLIPLSYALDSTSGWCILTNLLYTHILCRHRRSSIGHHFQLYLLAHSRPPNETDTVNLFHFLLYICDQQMMSQSVFPRLPDVSIAIPSTSSSGTSSSAQGRQRQAMPLWVPLKLNSFSMMNDAVKTRIMQPLFMYILRKVRPLFIMDRVGGRIALKYQFSRLAFLNQLPCVHLTFKLRSRQAVILEDMCGHFLVKVHADETKFMAEVKALTVLTGLAGVPYLLGSGSTVAGNKFVVMSKVGCALDEDVTDEEAQRIWDTILKHIHKRGLHHHDIVYHNITRDEAGSFGIIDFGESSPACPETELCADREWLAEHNVAL
ncbi:hypothetical protein NMY22_g6701 [Coprinellus aureogranulatus]|nr:hypothetical protein NMY22_g6701 [Coprinellus aureogranulatus]